MKFELYTDAALACDLPEHRLKRGDIVKLVARHVAPEGRQGYSIEVFNAVGDSKLLQEEAVWTGFVKPKCNDNFVIIGQRPPS